MLNLVNGMEFDPPYRPVRFNAFAEWGEYFWVPNYSAKGGASWSLFFEARFLGKVKTTAEALDAARGLIREIAPAEYKSIENAEMTDDLGWLVGAFPPTVREPVATLPSGRLVMPIGDMVMQMAPIGGLGMNNTLQYRDLVIQRVIAQGDRPFTAAWMRDNPIAVEADGIEFAEREAFLTSLYKIHLNLRRHPFYNRES